MPGAYGKGGRSALFNRIIRKVVTGKEGKAVAGLAGSTTNEFEPKDLSPGAPERRSAEREKHSES